MLLEELRQKKDSNSEAYASDSDALPPSDLFLCNRKTEKHPHLIKRPGAMLFSSL